MKTVLFKIVGTQPNGIKSLRLDVMYRVSTRTPAPEKSAAALARNFWSANGVEMTRFEVMLYNEPLEEGVTGGIGMVYLSEDPPITFDLVDGELIFQPRKVG